MSPITRGDGTSAAPAAGSCVIGVCAAAAPMPPALIPSNLTVERFRGEGGGEGLEGEGMGGGVKTEEICTARFIYAII